MSNTTELKEGLEWFKKHKASVERRNKILIGIGVVVETVAIAGVLNYYMLLQINQPSMLLAQFFAELGLLIPLTYANFKIVKNTHNDAVQELASLAWIVALLWVAVLAVAVLVVAAAALVWSYYTLKDD